MRKRRIWALLLALLLLTLPLLTACTAGGDIDTELLRQAGDVLEELLEDDGGSSLPAQDASNGAEAAAAAGFDDPAYFSRIYKQKIGVTPMETLRGRA